jgi:hypothetical protein
MTKEDLLKSLKVSKQIMDRLEKPHIKTYERFLDKKLIEEMSWDDIQDQYGVKEKKTAHIKFRDNPMEVL